MTREKLSLRVKKIEFSIGGHLTSTDTFILSFTGSGAELRSAHGYGEDPTTARIYSDGEADVLRERFDEIHTERWDSSYHDLFVLDGTNWRLIVSYEDGCVMCCDGSNAYPENFAELLAFFGEDDDQY